MKGLLRKDLYMALRYGRMRLVICVVFLAVGSVAAEEQFFFLVYPVLLGGILPVTLLSYDERFHWERTCETLPVTRAAAVSARYLMALLGFLLFFALTMLVQAVVLLPQGRGGELLTLAMLLPWMGLAAPSILLPVCFRFGVEKGRYIYYLIIGLLVLVGLLFADQIRGLAGKTVAFSAPLMTVALCALLFTGSWLLSIKLYESREL